MRLVECAYGILHDSALVRKPDLPNYRSIYDLVNNTSQI